MPKKIISVVGARPNFMKIAPFHKALLKYKDTINHLICHTGQHFDEKMSKVFFDELELPQPHYYLGISGGSHAQQTANIMIRFEEIVLKENPDLVVVVGDVNSTLACSIVAAKLNIKVAHIEAGLRSFDNTMPEEINRKLTDAISDYLFVSEESGLINLIKEGVKEQKIYFVGNIMIDNLLFYLSKADSSSILQQLEIKKEEYILITFHRPSNVDSEASLIELINFLNKLSKNKKLIFPIHPRTLNNLNQYHLLTKINSKMVKIIEPLGYIDFITLQKNAALVITDSGGVQEETTVLGVQCITVRDNTERPVTVELGTNQLIGTNLEKVLKSAISVLQGNKKKGIIPPLWDGQTAKRLADIIVKEL